MRLQTAEDGVDGGVELMFEAEEASMLSRLVGQLITLLESHSNSDLDPDPLFASLEIGGSDELPLDPALARLFPNAFEDGEDAASFRRVTEQGLLNRKLQDAIAVVADLSTPDSLGEDSTVSVNISPDSFLLWARTLTAVRLAIAARIGLETEEDHARLADDPTTRGPVLVFDWIAAVLEAVLALGTATSD